MSKFPESDFDHLKWLTDFKNASAQKQNFKSLRVNIFQHTISIVKQGGYQLNGKRVVLPEYESLRKHTLFYDKPPKITETPTKEQSKLSVLNADCIETAYLIAQTGYNPVVLNMANRQNPGGNVLGGAGAQEENIFRRSNIYASLYQFVDYACEYNLPRNHEHSYPLNRNTGGIYSPAVTIFRGSENNGYCLLKNPFQLSFISVPAMNSPELELINGEYRIVESLVEPAKEKIRTILRIAYQQQHDCLILSALGCGAFRNPPKHVASLFNQVFNELEFKNRFRLIVFAIIDDHNAWKEHNPEGNVLPFMNEFQ